MKRLFTLIIAIAIPCLVEAQDLDHLDHKKGYKNIRLEDTMSNINQQFLKAAGKDNDGISYFHYSDDKALQLSDNIKLQDIIIAFYENKVYSISLFFNHDQGPIIKDIFDRAYGDGIKSNEFMDDYYYNGDIFSLGIHYDATTKLPLAMFESVYLVALHRSRINQSNTKAAKDL